MTTINSSPEAASVRGTVLLAAKVRIAADCRPIGSFFGCSHEPFLSPSCALRGVTCSGNADQQEHRKKKTGDGDTGNSTCRQMALGVTATYGPSVAAAASSTTSMTVVTIVTSTKWEASHGRSLASTDYCRLGRASGYR